MTTEFLWHVPTSGDARYADASRHLRGERESHIHYLTQGVTDPRGSTFNYYDHLHQIGRAVELAKFDGIHIPNDPDGEESWIVAGYLARQTRYLKILTEFTAARGSAVYAAKNAVSYQRFSEGRFAWQLGTGGTDVQRKADGDIVDAKDIYPRIEEFLTVSKGVITQNNYSFKGRFFEVLEGGFNGPLSNQKVPTIYLSGNSEESYTLSAKHADIHVFDALPIAELRSEIDKLKDITQRQERKVGVGMRIDILARETEQEAVFDAQRFVEQSGLRAIGSAGLWHGLTTNHTGASASLVGNYEQVLNALTAYIDAGVTSFTFGATPALEEAYRVGEYLLPSLRAYHNHQNQRAA